MKRRFLVYLSAGLFLLSASAIVLSQPPSTDAPPIAPLDPLVPGVKLDAAQGPIGPPPTLPSVPLVPAKPKEDLLEELIGVLNKTESLDAFLITVGLMKEMGKDAKSAIPAILRNAERLGVLKNHLSTKSRDAEMVESLAETLNEIRGGEKPRTRGSSVGGLIGAASGALAGHTK